jgi:N-carbamoylputrescine amidase
MKLTVAEALPSLSRVKSATREPLRVALLQTRWNEDPTEHTDALRAGIKLAAEAGAKAAREVH